VVERWFFYIKHRIERFYKRFPWNAKYETVYRWLASFIVICTILYDHTSGEKLFKQPRLPEETIPNSITLKVSK